MIKSIKSPDGADINAKENGGATSLMMATVLNNFKIVKILLEKRADKNIKDYDNKTALDYAKENNRQLIIKLLK